MGLPFLVSGWVWSVLGQFLSQLCYKARGELVTVSQLQPATSMLRTILSLVSNSQYLLFQY